MGRIVDKTALGSPADRTQPELAIELEHAPAFDRNIRMHARNVDEPQPLDLAVRPLERIAHPDAGTKLLRQGGSGSDKLALARKAFRRRRDEFTERVSDEHQHHPYAQHGVSEPARAHA